MSRPSVLLVQTLVCRRCGVTMPDLLGPSRRDALAKPRQLAYALVRDLTTHSYPAIGRMFGGRDHGTIVYGVKTMRRLMGRETTWALDYMVVLRWIMERCAPGLQDASATAA